MRNRVVMRGLIVLMALVASCVSPHLNPIDVTLLSGECMCIDPTIEVRMHREEAGSDFRPPVSIGLKIESKEISIASAPRWIANPDPQEVASWIESHPASSVEIDAGRLVWINASIEGFDDFGSRKLKLGLGPGNGVHSIMVEKDPPITPVHDSSLRENLLWAKCKVHQSENVACVRDFLLNGLRARFVVSPNEKGIVERDLRIQEALQTVIRRCR